MFPAGFQNHLGTRGTACLLFPVYPQWVGLVTAYGVGAGRLGHWRVDRRVGLGCCP